MSRPRRAPLRVAVLFHESEILGAGVAVMRALDALRAYGWAPIGLFPRPGPLPEEALRGFPCYVHPGSPMAFSVRGWRRPPGSMARLRRAPTYLSAVRRALVRARPHVVHANTLLSLPEAMVAASLGLPVVMYVHEQPSPGAKAAATMRLAARAADVLVGGAGSVVDVLRRHAGRTPVRLVYEAVPRLEVPPPPRDSRWTVGTVGAISHRKGTDRFLEVARLVHDRRSAIRFEHVGQYGMSGDQSFDERVRRAAAPLVAEGVVTMRGWEPSLEALARWHAFVLPSRGELFPLSSLEAMACGRPVVATRVGGLAEQIDDGRTGILVPPDDPAAVAEAVVRLHDDPGVCERLGAAARADVGRRFSLERQAAGLHEAYLAAANLRFAPPHERQATRRSLDATASA